MGFHGGHSPGNDGVQLGTGGLLVEDEREAHAARSAEREVIERLINHAFVGHRDVAFLGRAQAGAAEANFLHRTAHVARRHEVAHAKGLVEEDGERGNEVLEAFFGRKGHRQPTNAQAADERRYIHPEYLPQRHQARDDDEKHLQQVFGEG